jgi:hypothetical protein
MREGPTLSSILPHPFKLLVMKRTLFSDFSAPFGDGKSGMVFVLKYHVCWGDFTMLMRSNKHLLNRRNQSPLIRKNQRPDKNSKKDPMLYSFLPALPHPHELLVMKRIFFSNFPSPNGEGKFADAVRSEKKSLWG